MEDVLQMARAIPDILCGAFEMSHGVEEGLVSKGVPEARMTEIRDMVSKAFTAGAAKFSKHVWRTLDVLEVQACFDPSRTTRRPLPDPEVNKYWATLAVLSPPDFLRYEYNAFCEHLEQRAGRSASSLPSAEGVGWSGARGRPAASTWSLASAPGSSRDATAAATTAATACAVAIDDLHPPHDHVIDVEVDMDSLTEYHDVMASVRATRERHKRYDQYWQANISAYPHLAPIIKRVLCIPVSSALAETTFSIVRDVLDDNRKRMSQEYLKYAVTMRYHATLVDKDLHTFVAQMSRH